MTNESTNKGGPTLLTPDEVSHILGIQPSTLANWRWRGDGPPYANLGGRRIRYRLCDLTEWISEQVRGCDGPEEEG